MKSASEAMAADNRELLNYLVFSSGIGKAWFEPEYM